ncbi:MAG: protein-glutamate O-methyltransferase CheR [Bdellovibrionales bacterium]|nr:protein-glutamate O-methyltransferase CheR [Bdellovibrionales bacterium]
MNLSVEEFSFVSELVRAEAAIVLEQGKEYLVTSRLGPLAKREGFETLGALIATLRQNQFGPLREKVVDAMTTNETSFFRDITPFEVLKKTVLPDLIEKRRAEKKLALWCAASSSGQEPYSVAMLIKENFPELATWSLSFIATDYSKEMLAQAKNGVYNQAAVNRGLPAKYLVRYFEKHGTDWQVKQEIRSMIQYRELNLVKPFTGIGRVDIVFIRNVLIYFEPEIKRQIFGKVHGVLKSDGYLFLGGAETPLNLDDRFVRAAAGGTVLGGGCYSLKGEQK